MKREFILGAGFVCALAACADDMRLQSPPAATDGAVWGATIDSISNISATATALSKLPVRMTTRIVFDEYEPAASYVSAVNKIAPVSDVMGELLDSFYVKRYTQAQYVARAQEYLAAMGSKVSVWEVGNEVNGEWLGTASSVSSKISAAYDVFKTAGKKTALTLYYNEGCWEKSANEMFKWAEANVPARMKDGLDYVWVSYYEDDCNGRQPDWQAVFDRLGEMFPNSKIGMGECGTTSSGKKLSYLKRYYNMSINHPRYVGGYFWWYFKQDMVPYTKKLWTEMNSILSSK